MIKHVREGEISCSLGIVIVLMENGHMSDILYS